MHSLPSFCIPAFPGYWVIEGQPLEQGRLVPSWKTEVSLEHMSRHMLNYSETYFQEEGAPSNLNLEQGRPRFGADLPRCSPPCEFNMPPALGLSLGFAGGWLPTFKRLMPCLARLIKEPGHACAARAARGSQQHSSREGFGRFL